MTSYKLRQRRKSNSAKLAHGAKPVVDRPPLCGGQTSNAGLVSQIGMAPEHCLLCPRKCGVNRAAGQSGVCGGADQVKVARAALHLWEEPCISGTNGSGAVFFSGCPLGCCFCQNHSISVNQFGKKISVSRLAEIFLALKEQGAHNINLVSPLHWAPWVAEALRQVRERLTVPVVCNTGGYEQIETLQMLEGLVDIYLPDLKFYSSELSQRYAQAPDYFAVASRAVREMYRQVGGVRFDESGILRRGVIVRHLALPKARQDAKRVLNWLAEQFPNGEVLLSLMSQYTPFHHASDYPELGRRISTYEYHDLLRHACDLGLKGYMQERSSAKEEYTPSFDLTGI